MIDLESSEVEEEDGSGVRCVEATVEAEVGDTYNCAALGQMNELSSHFRGV
jgi:hypothetical protein